MKKQVEQFLIFLEARNLSDHTLRAYTNALKELAGLLKDAPIKAITRRDLHGFLQHLHERGVARTSVAQKLAAMKAFFKWLEAEEKISLNIASGLRPPTAPKRLPEPPSQSEIRHLLDGKLKTAFPVRDRALLVLLYATGIRVSELCGINMDDFEEPDMIVIRGKGKKERRVIYGGYAKAALEEYLPLREQILAKKKLETPALFFSFGPHLNSRVGVQRLDPRSVARILKQVAAAKSLPAEKYHPHILRHCFSTHCHDNGMPLEVVSKLLGHARLSTTVKYTQVSVTKMMTAYNQAHPHART